MGWGSILGGVATIGAFGMLGYGVYSLGKEMGKDSCNCSSYQKQAEETKVALRKCEKSNRQYRASRSVPDNSSAQQQSATNQQASTASSDGGNTNPIPQARDLGDTGGEGAVQ